MQLQGIVAAINALPALSVAAMVAILGFFSAIWLSVFGWFLFGLLAGIILLYAVFCIATAVSLWRRKEWGVIGRHPSHSKAAFGSSEFC